MNSITAKMIGVYAQGATPSVLVKSASETATTAPVEKAKPIEAGPAVIVELSHECNGLDGSAMSASGVAASASANASAETTETRTNGPSMNAQDPELEQFQAAFGSSVGDANYTAKFDFDNDGVIDLGDFDQLAHRREVARFTNQMDELMKAFGTESGQEGFSNGCDVNGDGCIDLADYDQLVSQNKNLLKEYQLNKLNDAFGSSSGDSNYNSPVDFNQDGIVDLGDFDYLAAH